MMHQSEFEQKDDHNKWLSSFLVWHRMIDMQLAFITSLEKGQNTSATHPIDTSPITQSRIHITTEES